MNDLNKIYTIVVDAGEYDSYQSITMGYFADKQKCLEFMDELHADVKSYVAEYASRKPASKLTIAENLRDESGFACVQVSESYKYSAGDARRYEGMVGLFQKLSEKYPQLVGASSSTGEPWDADGSWCVSVQEIPSFG